jgi:hypothetical protein
LVAIIGAGPGAIAEHYCRPRGSQAKKMTERLQVP